MSAAAVTIEKRVRKSNFCAYLASGLESIEASSLKSRFAVYAQLLLSSFPAFWLELNISGRLKLSQSRKERKLLKGICTNKYLCYTQIYLFVLIRVSQRMSPHAGDSWILTRDARIDNRCSVFVSPRWGKRADDLRWCIPRDDNCRLQNLDLSLL